MDTRPLAIRRAVPGDAPVLARLRYDFRAALGEPVEGEAEFVARCAAWMAERLANAGDWRCWVVESGGDVAGQLWVRLIEKVPNPVPELENNAYITNVYVVPAYRDAGAGKLLLDTALLWCRTQGVDSVVLWPTPRSRSLYARHGFAVRDDLMEAILDTARTSAHAGP